MDAFLQLGGGLLCEGEGDDVARLDTGLLEDVRDALRNHLCLTRAGTGNDLQRLVQARDGLSLGIGVISASAFPRTFLRPRRPS